MTKNTVFTKMVWENHQTDALLQPSTMRKKKKKNPEERGEYNLQSYHIIIFISSCQQKTHKP